MPDIERKTVYFVSNVDGFKDRYIVEYPKADINDFLVVYLHSGLSKAEQGFCHDNGWCCSDLRYSVNNKRGVYVSPDYRGDSWLNEAAESDMLSLITGLKDQYSVSKVILAGGSMGGTAGLIMASHHPNLIDAVIALCPATNISKLYDSLKTNKHLLVKQVAKSMVVAFGGIPAERSETYAYHSVINYSDKLKMPIVLRHGLKDEIISVEHSKALVEALKRQKTDYRFDEVPNGTHYSITVNAPWHEYLNWVLDRI